MIETVPLANAAEAYGRMMGNEARFRIVLVTGQLPRLSFDDGHA
jgi:D-arabinose 1-dehydrogenase-like Zn-dependent alcohol dehydrogenase